MHRAWRQYDARSSPIAAGERSCGKDYRPIFPLPPQAVEKLNEKGHEKTCPEISVLPACIGEGPHWGPRRSTMPSPITVQQLEMRAVHQLLPYAGNARTHSREQIAQIAASIREYGFVNPILAGADNVIIAGHARLLAAQQVGMLEVPVIVLGHLTEAQRRALVIADNQLALQAGWDEEMLRRELASLQNGDFPLDLIGFDDTDLARLLEAQDAVAGLRDEDAVPAIAATPVTLPGELWNLGQHKLLCGDATLVADVARLMAGEAADLVFTDPPWNVDYEGYTKDRLKMQGDRMTADEFRQFLTAAFASYRRIVKPGASLYVCQDRKS